MARKRPISPADFVRIWQQASDFSDVISKSGMTERSARARASRFRKKGVPLKRFSAGRAATDWTALKQLAESLGPKSRKG